MDQSLCAALIAEGKVDPTLWIPKAPGNVGRSGRDPEWTARVEQAARVCQKCSVRKVCLDDANSQDYPYGVWGGHLFGIGRRPNSGKPILS